MSAPEETSVVRWLNEPVYDFGTVEHNVPTSINFEFENTSQGTIVLQTVRTTCGCTAASWSEAPIEPGQKGHVRIEFDAYQKGVFKKKIRVFFDKQRQPEILWVTGDVI